MSDINKKLDRIIELLEELCDRPQSYPVVINPPYPPYPWNPYTLHWQQPPNTTGGHQQ